MSVDDVDTVPERIEDNEKAYFDPQAVKMSEPHSFSPRDLLSILRSIETNIHCTENKMRDEVEKRKKYRVDDCRRVHNYDEFITSFLAMLVERNMLADLVEHSLGRGQTTTQGDLREVNTKIKNTEKDVVITKQTTKKLLP